MSQGDPAAGAVREGGGGQRWRHPTGAVCRTACGCCGCHCAALVQGMQVRGHRRRSWAWLHCKAWLHHVPNRKRGWSWRCILGARHGVHSTATVQQKTGFRPPRAQQAAAGPWFRDTQAPHCQQVGQGLLASRASERSSRHGGSCTGLPLLLGQPRSTARPSNCSRRRVWAGLASSARGCGCLRRGLARSLRERGAPPPAASHPAGTALAHHKSWRPTCDGCS